MTTGAKKKRCGHVSCRSVATRVAIDGFMNVFLCDDAAHEPKGRWSIKPLTSPGANTYLEAK